MNRFLWTVGLLLLGSGLTSLGADPLDQWRWRNPSLGSGYGSIGGELWAVTYANGMFAAVGDEGTILSSPDGYNWTSENLGPIYGTNYYWAMGIAYGNGVWVAVGTGRGDTLGDISGGVNFAIVLTSPDLVTWTPQPVSEDFNFLAGIIFTNGQFVAAGGGWDSLYQMELGVVATSPDGTNWTEQNSGVTDDWLWDIAYGDGLYVATGTFTSLLVTSPDATNWTSYQAVAPVFGQWQPWMFPGWTTCGLVCAQGLFVSGGESGILVSPDGMTWTNMVWPINNTPDSVGSVIYANGRFVALTRDEKILTSVNGLQWTQQSTGLGNMNGVTYANGLFVAIGNGTAMISTDGIHWTNLVSGVTTLSLNGAAYGHGTFVAVGDSGTILYSTDGALWKTAINPIPNVSLEAVAWAGTNFVAVGEDGVILDSPDGINWLSVTNSSGNPILLGDVAYGGSQFVAVGSDGSAPVIMTSTNSSVWVTEDSGLTSVTNGLEGAAYGNGLFVVGAGAGVLTSPDGVVWTELPLNIADANIASLAYGNGIFVAVGSGGTILTSPDGTVWATNSTATSADLYRVIYAGGVFLTTGSLGTILTSTDGTNWVIRNSDTMNNLWGAAFGQNTFVVVGDGGTILQSGLLLAPVAQLNPVPGWSNSAFSLTVSASLGGQWEIQASTDLLKWNSLGTITITNTPMLFVDTGTTNFAQRFYRAVSR
jgi:hypothetical protein